MPNDTQHDWDDLFNGHEEPISPQPIDDDDIESKVVGSDDDDLERSAGVKAEDADDFAPANPAPRDEKDPAAEPEPPVAENMSGIELYLAQFDIEAGIIQFEDGTAKHFNDLDAAKQAEVLQSLHGAQASAVEDQYGLEEEEIGLLNYLRENNLSVEQMVDQLVDERVSSILALQGMASEDYAGMEADALYVKWLQETTPEATPEQIAADLAKAKELSNYDKLTNSLRSQFVQRQSQTSYEAQQSAIQEHQNLIDSQRQEIVDAVVPMGEIAGIALNQELKNSVLDLILETNEEGDSAFMDTVFADPETLFKAAFWYQYGEAIVAQRDEYWKKEKSAAYKRGKEDALGITPAPQTGRSFSSTKANPGKQEPHTARPAGRKQETDDGEDWSTLHT
jgi:hypothetical protein